MIRYRNLARCILAEPIFLRVKDVLERARKEHPQAIKKQAGTHVLAVFAPEERDPFGFTPIQIEDFVQEDQDGSSRLMIVVANRPYANGSQVKVSTTDVKLRIDFPLMFAYDEEELKKYLIYHIRFKVDQHDPHFTEQTSEPLRRGYIGITKRWFFQRFIEHEEKAKNNTGFLFHSVWHTLWKEGVRFHPSVQICGSADSLKEIYEMEEQAVEKYTLAPLGLNAIPGGMAGIRMMHQLRLLNSLKVGADERDAAIERLQRGGFAHGSPCAHYRKGHLRKLPDERLTWVSPCWVNLKEAQTT